MHATLDCAGIEAAAPAQLRERYLIESLFVPGCVECVRTDLDGGIVASALPLVEMLTLHADEIAGYELGIINLGGSGVVSADGRAFELSNRDGLFLGKNSASIHFSSASSNDPASFYIVGYPAHREFSARLVRAAEAVSTNLGSAASANRRTLKKYIAPEIVESCQLVMGITELAEGSVWNTMPCHTHARRSEVYLYFGMNADQFVMHLMGAPDQTRHLIVRNRQAVLSPRGSIHTGAGTGNYSFIWAMGGDNRDFADIDPVAMGALR
jgi:4-deoxy-L-threo-5-hexosulose-uronate ketol-isomerase